MWGETGPYGKGVKLYKDGSVYCGGFSEKMEKQGWGHHRFADGSSYEGGWSMDFK